MGGFLFFCGCGCLFSCEYRQPPFNLVPQKKCKKESFSSEDKVILKTSLLSMTLSFISPDPELTLTVQNLITSWSYK